MTKLNINDLTLGEIKEINRLFNSETTKSNESGINSFVGNKAIIRTHVAGVFYGRLVEKCGKEVIVENARRLYYWKTVDGGISLSEVALTGLHADSKVCAPADIWLEAIEIIPCSEISIKSIEGKNEYKA